MRKGSAFVVILVCIGIIAVIGMLGFIIFIKPQSTSMSPSGYTQSMAPKIPVKDYAPNIPMNQKTTILIQTSDSSDIKYIVPKDQVGTYTKNLPEGYHIVSISP